MLGHFPKPKTDIDPATLLPWIKDTILRSEDSLTTDIQVRLRGNILHVLCESAEVSLPRNYVLMRLVRSLMNPEIKARFESEFPQIYQIFVYNRQARQPKPVWSAPIYLNRLERHLERLVAVAAEEIVELATTKLATAKLATAESVSAESVSAESVPAESEQPELERAELEHPESANPESANPESANPESAVIVTTSTQATEQLSDIILARQGDSGAIARYLSETLSALRVGVKVSARVVPGKARRARSVVGTHSTDAQGNAIAAAEEDPGDRTEAPSVAPSKSASEPASESAKESTGRLYSELVSRLWIFCEASYSPDPLLIAEPIAERLRQLHLSQFQDAVITIQVTGEASSDWRLRVDLTPPEDMLREWGRWGDVPALSRLANQISQTYGLKLIAEVKKSTLHLISYPVPPAGSAITGAAEDPAAQRLNVDGLVADIETMLTAISPQGIHRAMIYGPSTDDISPEWLRGIDLPAMHQPRLTVSTAALAAEGDMPALAYCLTRVLNPDMKDQLATGGIRVQLLLKDQLLHIMTDGPICPPKHGIVPLITQTLKQLAVPDLAGIRLYGRRAGQKQPIWSHGTDYMPRQRLVPEAKPEFAASEAYIGELITSISDESLDGSAENETAGNKIQLGSMLVGALRYVMLKSQLFTPAEEEENLALPSGQAAVSSSFQSEGGKIALVFGVVGVLLAVQFDFMVGQALRQPSNSVAQLTPATTSGDTPEDGSQTADVGRIKTRNSFRDELANLNWGRRQSGQAQNQPDTHEGFLNGGGSRFDSRDFTASAIDDDELIYSPQKDFVSTETLLAGSTLPSFRSQQLDEKIALYRRRVAQSGPPDVLVIGSSRALRGVDPAALRQALEQAGHDSLSVFNFGVNGATAQVVDLIVRRLIPPDQLPQVIVWADGARAFNSGRTDVTFNAIAVSEGYKQLEAGNTSEGINDLALGSLADQVNVRAKATDRQMSEVLGRVSSSYEYRGTIRSALSQGFGAIAPEFSSESESTRAGDTPTGLPTETSLIDFDGFLALSTRFNPATYYQDHARVAGAYDGDYKDFQLAGKQADALNSLLSFTKAQEVPVIFINTPLTDEYLDSRRTEAEAEFQQYMLEVANRSALMMFRDLGQLWPQRYDYFSDPSHLNRYGAYQVSTRLAQDPMIPWPQSLSRPK